MVNDNTIRHQRGLLRRVLEHIEHSTALLGSQRDDSRLVDVITHPQYRLPELNYATPRRGTAWVTADAVREGLKALGDSSRTPRFMYAEGAIPPQFVDTLLSVGLRLERAAPVMAFSRKETGALPSLDELTPPRGVSIMVAARESEQHGSQFWRTLWTNPSFEHFSLGVEPLVMVNEEAPVQADVIVQGESEILGAIRITVFSSSKTAHMVALAFPKETHGKTAPLALARVMFSHAVRFARNRGADLIFAPGYPGVSHFTLRDLHFEDIGRLAFYTEGEHDDTQVARGSHAGMAQHLLSLF